MRLVPIDKFDDEACEHLKAASDEEVIPHIERLLECLQDLNWPIAPLVSERLSMLGLELVQPILRILSGNDEMWKYWIVSHLLYQVSDDVFCQLRFKLNSIKLHPTKSEVEEEVFDAVCELLRFRRN
ncbi:DUF5071 domain-containing protein [Microbulbifer thermotolerans]|uniref:DUF5071 domain-containing protein n=1 Tax=Microbulbifer thermotolerans TaxID=252514 RepID=UPI0009425444|nr:DUF5071 domain-containing protein [Microbulbifer thermotolerans]